MTRQTVKLSKFIALPISSMLLLLITMPITAWSQWQNIAPGIDYQDLSQRLKPWAHIHAFRINLAKNTLNIGLASQLTDEQTSSVSQLARKLAAPLGLNGGFFSKQYSPLGLRIQSGKIINPVKNISWWGILMIKNARAQLLTYRQYRPSKAIDFAIQSGPRLLINGRIPKLKPGLAERSAIGILPSGDIVLIATDHHPLSTYHLAKLMKNKPLNCRYALNLDGGSSTQLIANFANFKLSVNGFSNITDAILVKPKSAKKS